MKIDYKVKNNFLENEFKTKEENNNRKKTIKRFKKII